MRIDIRSRVGLVVLLAITVGNIACGAGWYRKTSGYGFAYQPGGLDHRPPLDSPIDLIWQSLDVAVKGDKIKFTALYDAESEKACGKLFQEWQGRAKTWEVDFPVWATNKNHQAYVGIKSRQRAEANAKVPAFTDVIFLHQVGTNWVITSKILDARAKAAAIKKMNRWTSSMSEAQMLSEYKVALAHWQKESMKGTPLWMRKQLAAKKEEKKRLISEGVKIPKTFSEMIKRYNGKLYNPPIVFDAGTKPAIDDYTNWDNALRNGFHLLWKGGSREDIAPAWGTSIADLNRIMCSHNDTASLLVTPLLKDAGLRQVQILAVVPVLYKKVIPLRFVYYHVVNPSKPYDNEWIETGHELFKKVNGRWECTSDGRYYPGIIQSIDTSAKDTQSGGELCYQIGGGWHAKGSDLQKLLRAAKLPAPFDRLYRIQ